MKKWFLIISGVLFIFFLLIVSGCGGDGGPTPSSTLTPTPGETATPIPGTTSTPAPAKTATPGKTATPVKTPTPTPSHTPSPSPSPTLSPSPTPIKIAYIYDSVDSPACASITTVLSGYSVTQIPHDTVTITTLSLSSYALIIIADQANYWEYDQSLANTIINAGKPIIAMGMAADYFYMNQNVVSLPGLSSCGSGTGLTQIVIVNATNPIWTTPNTISISPVTVLSTGHGYYAVTKTNWPGSFATNGISIATPIGSPTWHILARESDKYFFWGLWGSIDDLTATGKNLFVNTVHYMLNN